MKVDACTPAKPNFITIICLLGLKTKSKNTVSYNKDILKKESSEPTNN